MSLLGVRLGSLNMNGLADGNGDKLRIADVTGLDSAPVNVKKTERADMGASLDQLSLSARELTIQGMAYPASTDAPGLLRVRDKLSAAFASLLAAPQTLFIDLQSPGVSIQLNVIPGGALHFDTPISNIQKFEIPLTALDPRKYSQTLHTVAVDVNASLVNGGNAPSPMVAVCTTAPFGSLAPLFWNETTGGQLQLRGPVTAGWRVDFGKKLITDATGVPREYASLPRTWWQVMPGSNALDVDGKWSVTFRDAWY